MLVEGNIRRVKSSYFARRPRAAMTPLTPVSSLMVTTSSKFQMSPFPTQGTSPFAASTANLMDGNETA